MFIMQPARFGGFQGLGLYASQSFREVAGHLPGSPLPPYCGQTSLVGSCFLFLAPSASLLRNRRLFRAGSTQSYDYGLAFPHRSFSPNRNAPPQNKSPHVRDQITMPYLGIMPLSLSIPRDASSLLTLPASIIRGLGGTADYATWHIERLKSLIV